MKDEPSITGQARGSRAETLGDDLSLLWPRDKVITGRVAFEVIAVCPLTLIAGFALSFAGLAGIQVNWPYFNGLAAFSVACLWIAIFSRTGFVKEFPILASLTFAGLILGCGLTVYIVVRPNYRGEFDFSAAGQLVYLFPPFLIALLHACRFAKGWFSGVTPTE